MVTPVQVHAVDAADPAVDAVLAQHHADMRATSPEESCHVMTAAALRSSGARVFALRIGADVAAVGALKPMANGAVELKSMHCLARWRGQGLGRVLLEALLTEARMGKATKAFLETGSAADFDAARGLYAAVGFQSCAPFGDYVSDPLSVFMCKQL